VLITPSLARAHGWETALDAVLVSYPRETSPDTVEAALAAAEARGAPASVERGDDTGSQAILLALAAIAGFVTLVGVAISVSLSAAEGRADLATLAAVGAPPRRRRALAASQALLVAGLGCALGLASGSFIAYTARSTTGSPEFVVPWGNLAVTGVVVPALAVLVAAAFTPSRLPLVRRVT
jgi:putative ABC transport system permease protein